MPEGSRPVRHDDVRSMSSSGKPGRHWMGTIPVAEGSEEFNTTTFPNEVVYSRGQQEVGANGFRHWQIIIYLRKPQRLSWLKSRIHGTAHWEQTRSSACESYVWKEDTYVEGTRYEFGTKPFRRNEPKDWDRVLEQAKKGDLEGIPADIVVRYYSSIIRIRQDFDRCVGIQKTVNVYWGATGVGKSRTAWEQAGLDAYAKDPLSKWWDGYQGEKHVVMDEFRGIISVAHLLRWFDRYPIRVEVKGSSRPLLAETVWITSNLHPSDWYPELDEETKKALMRRLTVRHFVTLENQ